MTARRRLVWSTWIALWLVSSLALGSAFIHVANVNRSKAAEHLVALNSRRDGSVCGAYLTKYSAHPVYEYLVRWHSEDPPNGLPADFAGRFCGSVVHDETAIRTRQRDGSYLVQTPGVTDQVEASLFGVVVAGLLTTVAAMFLHRRRPNTRPFSRTYESGAQL